MKLSDISKESLKTRSVRVRCWYSIWLLCIGGVDGASAAQAPEFQPQTSRVHVRTRAVRPTVADTVTPSAGGLDLQSSQVRDPASRSNTGAGPATVVLENGSLTVTADNSDLSQILETLAHVSGMTINGKIRSSRVYGVYGPLDPRDVLAHLLKGSGNNFLMVGVVQDGAPRELLLTPEKIASPPDSSFAPSTVTSGSHENSGVDTSKKEQLGPGAILHVPPAPPEDPEVRMRQNLERLKHRHEQQIPQNLSQ